jgi:hypothetical protein
MSAWAIGQTFSKLKDMSAPPSKAEIGGVTDAQAPELGKVASRSYYPEMSRRRATASQLLEPRRTDCRTYTVTIIGLVMVVCRYCYIKGVKKTWRYV